jgi:hypothetical protein
MTITPARAARIALADWDTIPPPDGPWDDPVLEQLADTDVSEIVDPPLAVIPCTGDRLRRRDLLAR